MKYPYLTLLIFIRVIAIITLESTIFYLLIKFFKRDITLKPAIKSFLLYSSFSVLVVLLNYIFSSRLLLPGFYPEFMINTTILFLLFYYSLKRFVSIDFKKSFIIFLICFIFVFPLSSGGIQSLFKPFINKPPFKTELEQFRSQVRKKVSLDSFYGFSRTSSSRTKLSILLHSWNLTSISIIESGLRGMPPSAALYISSGIGSFLEHLRPSSY